MRGQRYREVQDTAARSDLRNRLDKALRSAKTLWARGNTKTSLEEFQARELLELVEDEIRRRGNDEFKGPLRGGKDLWVPGPPRSNTRHRKAVGASSKATRTWREKIGWKWRERWGSTIVSGPVMVRALYATRLSVQDVDNMVKPTFDGLKQVAFGDDTLVYDLHVRKEPADRDDDAGARITVAPYRGPVFESHI